jgi:hypothetical protein
MNRWSVRAKRDDDDDREMAGRITDTSLGKKLKKSTNVLKGHLLHSNDVRPKMKLNGPTAKLTCSVG